MLESRVRIPQVRGLQRDRLSVLFAGVQRRRVTNLVAPAGSGKTTALAHYAHETSLTETAAVAWYSLDTHDGGHLTLLAELQHAVARACDVGTDGSWGSALEASAALEALPLPLVIIIDDAHLLSPGSACEALGELLARLPDSVSVVIGSRVAPPVDLTTLRVEGHVLDLNADDLRFRTWEAERLLTETFGLLLQPDDVARLTRQVGGWAAGFQLYRLAAQDLPPAKQRKLARTTSTHSMLAQRYLAQNLLNALRPRERDFLLRTSVLGVISPETADDLLQRSDSATILRELESAGGFVTQIDESSYRYHEVLQSHLEAELADVLDGDELRAHYLRAARLLEAQGLPGESVRCYARVGHREAITRLLEALHSQVEIHASVGLTMAFAHDSELSADPWVTLLRARADAVSGKFQQALDGYIRAEQRFATLPTAETCRRERLELSGFIDVSMQSPVSWIGTFRRGLQSDPVGAADELTSSGSSEAHVAGAFLLFLSGHYAESGRQFEMALLQDTPSDWLIDVARLGRQLTRLINAVGEPEATHTVIERLMAKLDMSWVGRLALPIVAAAIGDVHRADATSTAERCSSDGDPWGAAIGYVFAGVNAHGTPHAVGCYQRALEFAEQQDSDVLRAWALGGLAVSQSDSGKRREQALRAGRRAGLRGMPIEVILEATGRRRNMPPVSAADDAQTPISAPPTHQPERVRAQTTTCFGEFRVASCTEAVDQLRPRARAVLMRLALDSGRPISVDTLIDDIWGAQAPSRSHRGLQVAVSSIRGALEADGAERTVERVDAGYMLTEPNAGSCDAVEFLELASVGTLGSHVESEVIVQAAARAMSLANSELLPEAGSAEWVVSAREHMRRAGARLARRAAEAALELNDVRQAIDFAERGLDFDGFDDELWRIAIGAHEQCGDAIAASRLRGRYQQLLETLEIHR